MVTVTLEKLTADDAASLVAWLREREEYNRVYGKYNRVYGSSESNATQPPMATLSDNERLLLQDARQHAADAEKEADKLRDVLAKFADAVRASQGARASIPDSHIAYADIAEAAVKAYDNSSLKIPF